MNTALELNLADDPAPSTVRCPIVAQQAADAVRRAERWEWAFSARESQYPTVRVPSNNEVADRIAEQEAALEAFFSQFGTR